MHNVHPLPRTNTAASIVNVWFTAVTEVRLTGGRLGDGIIAIACCLKPATGVRHYIFHI